MPDQDPSTFYDLNAIGGSVGDPSDHTSEATNMIANKFSEAGNTSIELPDIPKPKFAESIDPSTIIDKVAPPAISGLEKQTPEMRAENGAKFGAQIGFKNGGHMGAVIGGAIGAYAARGIGQVKSGEHDTNIQMEKFGDALNTMKISDKKGNINFSDGSSVPLPQGKLKNLRASVSGKSQRESYEYDTSNPFTNRTTTVAKPIALFLAGGILKTNRPEAVQKITGTICNALQTDAKDINTIYKRAADMASKLGVKPAQMASFIQSLNLPESQAKDVKKGLELLYARH